MPEETQDKILPEVSDGLRRRHRWLVIVVPLLVGIGLCFGLTRIVDQVDNASSDTLKKVQVRTKAANMTDVHGLDNELGAVNGPGDEDLLSGRVRPVNGSISLRGSHLSKKGIDYLLKMPGIKSINLEMAKLSDEDFGRLLDYGMTSIFARGIDTITDTGLSHLKNTRVWRLGVTSELITSAGYMQIADTPSIYDFTVKGAKGFKDEDLEYLAKHATGMKTLDISGTSVTGPALKCLVNLKKLESLKFNALGADDKDVTPLTVLPLREIEAAHNNIGDASLNAFSTIRTLRTLAVEACPKITDRGLDNFERQLPQCKVLRKDEAMLFFEK